MPKGKPKVKHPELYVSEDEEEKARRRLAPQAAPHRRGGTHRVKDTDRTNTHWDNKNYRELLTAVRERRLWVKDMPKREMAKVLAEKDRHDAMIVKRANTEAYKKRKQLEEKKQKQLEEQRRLREEKEQRAREGDMSRPVAQDVSGLSEDEDESPLDGNVGAGQILSDDGDEYESSTTNTTTPSSLAPIVPTQKLRIFEWQYEDAPPDEPPLSPFSASGRIREEALPELLPKKLPYAVMDVMTTKTGERLELSGRAMPEEVGPDFVPSLSEHTKDCARNGVLVKPLRNAIIERGTDWATRTQVQWWNGRMYFHLPPRKSKADLASVYAKWRKKKDTRSKAEPKEKAQQRLKDQREKMLDIYRVSEYRPPICYVPSYLNYPLLDDDNDEVKTSPRNLFYIRFQNMSLPHYFFWSDPEEWEDPTIPNPAWVKTEHEPALDVHQVNAIMQPHLTLSQQNIEPVSAIAAPKKHLQVKQKRTPVPHKFSVAASPPKGSKYRVALWTIERDLYHHGWANTMYVLRDKWLREGKEREWMLLISRLVREFPAGRLPTSPPVGPPPQTTSLAEKFAAVEVPSSQRPVEPIQGDEHWTRDDAAYWVTIDVPEQKLDQDEPLGSLGTPTEPQALHRKGSEVFAWMDNLSSPSSPLRVPAQTSPQSDTPFKRRAERKAWEERFMQHVEEETALLSTIDSMPVAELKHNLFNLMNERRRSSFDEVPGRCAFCLTSLNGLTFDEWRAHYETHANSANEVCPFCGMVWAGWTSEIRAAHIFCHDVDEGVGRNTRRKSSGISSGINALAAVPKTKREASGSGRGKEKVVQTRPRKLSKVHFSPITVERRIGYNDFGGEDTGVDADVSSIATVSPRRSSLRSPIALTEAPRKSALKIDTSPNSGRNTRSKKYHPHKPATAPEANYQDPSSSSTHCTSPGLHLGKRPGRLPGDHPDGAWNPKRHSMSGSEHIPSPHLPRLVTYPPGHPDAGWEPSRTSRSSFESLEFHTGRRGPKKDTRKGKRKQNKALERRSSRSIAKSKGKRKAVDEDEYAYVNEPSSASSYELAAIYTKRSRPQDPSYRDASPSTPSSLASRLSMSTKRKKPSDLTFLDQDALPSPFMADERPTKRRKTKGPKTKITPKALRELTPIDDVEGPHRDSTVSSVSSTSDARRHTALKRPGLDVINKPKGMRKDTVVSKSTGASSLGSRVSSMSKQRKTSSASSKALSRRCSSGSDYIAFMDDHLFKDHTSDVLTGNPFAAPTKTKSKTTRGKTRTVSKAKEPVPSASYSPKKDPKASKVPTSVKTALESKKSAAAAELKASRTAAAKMEMTTILELPFVEPLVIAPTRRWSKSCSTPSTSASSINSIADFLDPPTSSSSKASSPKTVRTSKERPVSSKVSKKGKASLAESWNANGRGRRSSAPTPSPGRVYPSGRPSISSNASSKLKGKVKASPLPIGVGAAKRKASYDIPFSDTRPIVPPNTPATGLLSRTKCSDTDEDSNGTPLDVSELSDKIGKVQTTRRGQACQLSLRAIESIVSKGKARGSIRKVTDQEDGKSSGGAKKGALVSDKSLKNTTKTVAKKGIKLTKPAGMKKAAVKPPSRLMRKRKSEVEKLMQDLGSSEKKRAEEGNPEDGDGEEVVVTKKDVNKATKPRPKAATKKGVKPVTKTAAKAKTAVKTGRVTKK